MLNIYDFYSQLAFMASVSCLIVAITLTSMKSKRIVDLSFTIREWIFAVIFLLSALVARGYNDDPFDTFTNRARETRYVFMFLVIISSLISVSAIIYNVRWRHRHTQKVNRYILMKDED